MKKRSLVLGSMLGLLMVVSAKTITFSGNQPFCDCGTLRLVSDTFDGPVRSQVHMCQ